jgi:chemotaxis protein CheD
MDYFLKMSQILVAADSVELKTVVGSCIALCLWDRTTKIGGMAHIVLPERNGDKNANEGRYADTAVSCLVSRMVERGADARNFVAASVGGASMFNHSRISTCSVGTKNALSVRMQLEKLKIPIMTEDVGGFSGRKVTFRCSDGKLEVTVLNRRALFSNISPGNDPDMQAAN